MNNRDFLTDQELDLLNKNILDTYGYDFSGYTQSSFKRRASRVMLLANIEFSELIDRIKTDQRFFYHFLNEITVNVTDVFRDPWFFKSIREQVIPYLHSYPVIRIWHAGCSSGEEVYSMAILMHEEGLLDRTLLYATDLNTSVLDKGKVGAYPIEQLKYYEQFYKESGGKASFTSYINTQKDDLIFKDFLRKKIIFAQHNLITDQSFNEFNIILCRNVLIYFNKDLQNKVLVLLHRSLAQLGYLALGEKETLEYACTFPDYEIIDRKAKIYRKK